MFKKCFKFVKKFVNLKNSLIGFLIMNLFDYFSTLISLTVGKNVETNYFYNLLGLNLISFFFWKMTLVLLFIILFIQISKMKLYRKIIHWYIFGLDVYFFGISIWNLYITF